MPLFKNILSSQRTALGHALMFCFKVKVYRIILCTSSVKRTYHYNIPTFWFLGRGSCNCPHKTVYLYYIRAWIYIQLNQLLSDFYVSICLGNCELSYSNELNLKKEEKLKSEKPIYGDGNRMLCEWGVDIVLPTSGIMSVLTLSIHSNLRSHPSLLG